MNEFVSDQTDLNRLMVKTFGLIDERLESMSDSIGTLKGGYARAEVEKDAGVIALDMGLGYIHTVSKYELAAWAQRNTNIKYAKSELQSFRRADLVIQTTDNSEVVYVAVEVSFTADKRDTDRALRNAEMLTYFTGCKARAAIASVANDHYVTEQVNHGLIHWHQIDEHSVKLD
jgi:hypothetical protein